MDISHQDIQTNGVSLHVAACGPKDAPLVILLHGFPEYWGAWESHMRLIAAKGYLVIAPDQRGYNTSDKPRRMRDYSLDLLAEDIVGLIEHHHRQQARIVGHDWGGAVAWHVARVHPERLARLVVINCPPTDVFRRFALRHPGQLLRSWYIVAMQIPWVMRWALTRRNFAKTRRTMRRSSKPGTFDAQALAGHMAAWAQPDAFRSMINWYRAAIWRPPRRSREMIEVPTLLLWGERDRFLSKGLVKPSLAACADARAVRYPEATHWLQHEQPDAVVDEMLEFFGEDVKGEDE